MKVNIAVPGRFHYHNYVTYLNKHEILNKFYYSHKINTASLELQVEKDKLVNIWLKEYLIRAHVLISSYQKAEKYFPIYHDLWESTALLRWHRCDILHAMLHGTSRNLINKAKSQGSLIVGEPVNSHPENLNTILNQEHERLGIVRQQSLSISQKRLVQEVEECDYLLVGSNFVKKSYIKKGFAPQKIHLINYGVDLSRFRPLLNKKEKESDKNSIFRVICVAQISPRKGHIYLLEAWKQLNLSNSELLFIGSLNKEMHTVLVKYDGLFKHIPFVPNAELYKYYSQSSVFVLPSLEEGFACVVPEAMACGLPVVVTENTGTSDIVEHSKDGFIVPIRSAATIAEYLELLYSNRDLCHAMSQAALAKSQSNLSWQQYADKLCNFYNSIWSQS
jgi:glycosyltransferase involved in cell wall biosynthesis